jgi:hypothetical protein
MKVYFMEINVENKATFMSVDHSQRAKVWVSHPAAKEISKKEYESIKLDYEQMKKTQPSE